MLSTPSQGTLWEDWIKIKHKSQKNDGAFAPSFQEFTKKAAASLVKVFFGIDHRIDSAL
jgi:hypothetical protein